MFGGNSKCEIGHTAMYERRTFFVKELAMRKRSEKTFAVSFASFLVALTLSLIGFTALGRTEVNAQTSQSGDDVLDEQTSEADQNDAAGATGSTGGTGSDSAGRTTDTGTTPVVVILPLAIQKPFPGHGCWAHVFEDDNFNGPSLVVEGPRELANLDSLDDYRFFDSPGDSLIVGPNARVTLYEDERFTGNTVAARRNQRIADVSARFQAFESMESMKVPCVGKNSGTG
jgi:hypothetical protein